MHSHNRQRVKGARMKTVHDIFLRAFAVAADQKKRPKRSSRPSDDLKWPEHALVFDTETRITEDQSLTFGVFRLCELADGHYRVTREGIFYADDLPTRERKVLEAYRQNGDLGCNLVPARIPAVLPYRVHAKSVLARNQIEMVHWCVASIYPSIFHAWPWSGARATKTNGRSRCHSTQTEPRIETFLTFSFSL